MTYQLRLIAKTPSLNVENS